MSLSSQKQNSQVDQLQKSLPAKTLYKQRLSHRVFSGFSLEFNQGTTRNLIQQAKK